VASANAQDVTLSAPGAPDQLIERLEANALLLRSPEDGAPRSGQDLVAAARADYGRLIGILYEQGYFSPVIRITLDGQDAARISPFSAPARVQRAEISIQTGPAFRLGTAEIAPLAPETDLPAEFQTDAPATTTVLRSATRAALDGWRAVGHATAEVTEQRITARNADAILDARVRLDPGPVVTFGDLRPTGQQRMTEARIRDIAGLPVGETYSPETLERAEERLRDSGAFSAVQLSEGTLRSGDVMDITATLDEAPLRRFGFGFEISSDEGIGASAYWLHRNLFGGAERLRFDAEISGVSVDQDAPDISLGARFDRPATITPDTLFTLEALAFDINDPLFEQTAFGIEARLSDRINRTLTGSLGVGIGYNAVRDRLGRRDVVLFALPATLTWDNRDSALDARDGYFADIEVTPFLPLGGTGGARAFVDGRAYTAFGENEGTRLAARLQFGTVSGATITDLPPDFLFYSGGSGTVRGHDYQSLGAIQNGVLSGGRSFVGLSGEVRHDIGDTDFGIVGFADFGMVAADEFWAGNSDWQAGAGLGLRYNTPFGPIRIDLATPVDSGRAGRDVFFYIGIGQSF